MKKFNGKYFDVTLRSRIITLPCALVTCWGGGTAPFSREVECASHLSYECPSSNFIEGTFPQSAKTDRF